jgi:hypothetical protein
MDDLLESGGSVLKVNDLSPRGNDAIQSNGTYQPSYNSSDANYNNQPTITFNNDFFVFLRGGVNVDYTFGTVIMFIGNIISGQKAEILGANEGSNNRFALFADISRVRNQYKNFTRGTLTDDLTDSTLSDPAIWMSISDNTTIYWYKNGILVDSEPLNVFSNGFTEFGACGSLIRSQMTVAEFRIYNKFDLAKINSFGSDAATDFGFSWTTIT